LTYFILAFSKFKEKKDNTLNLHPKGIYEKYGIIVLYEASKKYQLLLQISGADDPEKTAEQWLNYLAVVVASDEQKEHDKSIWDKLKDKLGKLFTGEELSKVWGEEEEDILLDESGVWWVTQFNEALFGSETCWSQECCNKAARKIVSNAGATAGDRIIIAQTNRQCEGTTGARTKYDDSGLTFNEKEFEEAVQIIDISLKEHKLPIMIGVQHPYWHKKDMYWYYKCGSKDNAPRATNHFIVIIGKGYDQTKKMDFYYFYEVGTSDKNYGKSKSNKLWVDTNQHRIKGNVSTNKKEDYYIVTDVRKNLGKTYNLKNNNQ
jgi:hypothetical protein